MRNSPHGKKYEKLVDRLEGLLAELEQSDARVLSLTELLKASEDANVAIEEERQQVESWLGEVERRVGAWEEEWNAEREGYRRSIAELTAERDQLTSHGASPDQQRIIGELRQLVERLNEERQLLTTERDELQQRIASAEISSVEDRVAAEVEEVLRQERLKQSQLKAELARERQAIAEQREELAQAQASGWTPG